MYTGQQISDRLSISTIVFQGYQPVCLDSLAMLASHGITRVELLESREQFDMTDQESMQHTAKACQKAGVAIVAYHAHNTHFSGMETEKERETRVDYCKRQIDTLLSAGGRVWSCHAQQVDEDSEYCFLKLLKHVEGTGTIIALENFAKEGVSPQDRMAFLDRMNHPQLGLLLDIGHVRDAQGQNPMTIPGGPTQILSQCGHRLYHVHLHGFVNGKDHYPPFAADDGIQWAELFRALAAADYGGYFNFEPVRRPSLQTTLELTEKAPGIIARLLNHDSGL
jgi:sugar phosphate isomerase/epimerase